MTASPDRAGLLRQYARSAFIEVHGVVHRGDFDTCRQGECPRRRAALAAPGDSEGLLNAALAEIERLRGVIRDSAATGDSEGPDARSFTRWFLSQPYERRMAFIRENTPATGDSEGPGLDVESIAAALDAHEMMTNPLECSCGDWSYRDERPGNYFRDHQARAVAARLRDDRADR